MAQVEGHGLRGRQCGVATGLGPRPELLPGGGIGAAGVPAVASRSPAATASAAPRSRSGRSTVLWSCWTTGRSVVMDVCIKFVITLYYHGFYSPLKKEKDLAVGQAPWVPSRCFDDRVRAGLGFDERRESVGNCIHV